MARRGEIAATAEKLAALLSTIPNLEVRPYYYDARPDIGGQWQGWISIANVDNTEVAMDGTGQHVTWEFGIAVPSAMTGETDASEELISDLVSMDPAEGIFGVLKAANDRGDGAWEYGDGAEVGVIQPTEGAVLRAITGEISTRV